MAEKSVTPPSAEPPKLGTCELENVHPHYKDRHRRTKYAEPGTKPCKNWRPVESAEPEKCPYAENVYNNPHGCYVDNDTDDGPSPNCWIVHGKGCPRYQAAHSTPPAPVAKRCGWCAEDAVFTNGVHLCRKHLADLQKGIHDYYGTAPAEPRDERERLRRYMANVPIRSQRRLDKSL